MAMNLSFTSSQASFPAQLGLSKPKSSKYLMSIRDSRNKQANWKKMTPEKLEIFTSLEGWVENNILTFLKPVETLWQPQDFLPNPSCPNEEFFKSIMEIREQAEEVPDEYFVCIVGNMITEEALPTYQSAFNRFEGVRDTSGMSLLPWAKWTRRWTAEDNRHGDLLNKYLYLSGRLDMRQIEKTIQYFIGSGMERATFISHGNTACHAKKYGDATLAKICGSVASDEKRHEYAYTKIVEKLFEIDPNTTMLALGDMMRRRITMPALFMFDGGDDNLFNHYSTVPKRLGIYTSKDYVDIVEFFVKRWRVEEVNGLSSEGRKAQDYVCGLVERLRQIEERAMEKKKSN